jgi:hypothetical protein
MAEPHVGAGDRPDRPKRGRPHKGARHVIVTRPAKHVADRVFAEAEARGLSVSEYVARVLTEWHRIPGDHVPRLPDEQLQIGA